MDPDTRINDWWTVGEFEAEFEGQDYNPHAKVREKPHFYCDFCSKGITYRSKPTVAFYVADMVLNTDHPDWQHAVGVSDGVRPLVPLAAYCDGCAQRLLLFPCEGFAEVRAFFELDEDRVLKNVRVTDVSPDDDGIPWDPKDVSEKVTGIPFEAHMMAQYAGGEDQVWGPENIITFFLTATADVDPRELINPDGSYDPKALGRARKSWTAFQRKMRRGGYSRKKFRDHVRGGDGE